MSAELLRRAASEMRRRAEAATPGPWQRDLEDGGDYVFDVATGAFCFVPDYNCRLPVANADHIASWHPAVALAVADLIEAELAACGGTDVGLKRRHGANSPLFMLARAYLGDTA